MATLKEQILEVLVREPGMTDREITNRLRGAAAPQQPINSACRDMAGKGTVQRRKRADDLIGNYVVDDGGLERSPALHQPPMPSNARAMKSRDDISEDEVKQAVVQWLERDGWEMKVAWGRQIGIDIEATRSDERWVIEAKGCGSRPQMRVNYFLAILGETLQRMDDPSAKFSIALPDMRQYRGLWERLPTLAKERTFISVLFVSSDGRIEEVA